jgi:putative spermidine/putrescine transport system substrate-binding protein
MRKRTLLTCLVITVLAFIVLTACAGAPPAPAQPTAKPDLLSMSWDQVVQQAKAEKDVVFYAWWGEEFWKEAARRFNEKYGMNAQVIVADNVVDKLLAEKDKEVGTVDVQLIGGANVKTTTDAGVWYGPIFQKLPANAQLDQKLASYQEGVDTKGYLVPIYRNQTALLYDPERVANPPQNWDELVAWINANPKGFAFSDPNKGGTGQAFVQTAISNLAGGLDKYKGDTEVVPDKVANWNMVWDWFKTNLPKLDVTVSNNESLDHLNQGAAAIAVAWDDDTQVALKKGTLFKRAKMYIPSMGMPGGGDTAGIAKNAPHKAASLLFLDFLTSLEMQKLMNETIGSYPARTDITDVQQLLAEEQRQKYGTPWVPAAYKKLFSEEFTKQVLIR